MAPHFSPFPTTFIGVSCSDGMFYVLQTHVEVAKTRNHSQEVVLNQCLTVGSPGELSKLNQLNQKLKVGSRHQFFRSSAEDSIVNPGLRTCILDYFFSNKSSAVLCILFFITLLGLFYTSLCGNLCFQLYFYYFSLVFQDVIYSTNNIQQLHIAKFVSGALLSILYI